MLGLKSSDLEMSLVAFERQWVMMLCTNSAGLMHPKIFLAGLFLKDNFSSFPMV